MARIVYLLCAATALACAVLLLRGYARTGTRLLFWSGLCFVGLTLNNALVFVDIVLVPEVSLILWRDATVLGAVMVLLIGLVWESR